MEYIVDILLGFITLSFLLKVSFYSSYQQMSVVAIGCAAFILLTYEWLTEQSQTQIATFLVSPQRMQDVAVWITLESGVMIAFCFDCSVQRQRHETVFKRIVTFALNFYPGILIGAALSYAFIQLIIAFPGTNFQTIAYFYAICTCIGIICLAVFFKKLLSDRSIRLELLFITNVFILLLGIISTENEKVSYHSVSSVDIIATCITLGVFIIGTCIGMIWRYINKLWL